MKLGFPRSRLFWKIFACIWLAQLTAILAVGIIFSIERQQDHARWQALHANMETQAVPPNWPVLPPNGHPPAPPHPPGPPEGLPDHGPLPWLPLVATLLASLVFAALLAWYLSTPIRLLRSAFAAAASGQLETRVGTQMGKRRDELADLGHDFDRMAAQLATLMESQRRLLHDVSHELRSPLARLQIATGILRQTGERAPTDRDRVLERIDRESTRMDHLIGELLTLSRLEAGAPTFDAGPVDIRLLLEPLAADARFEAEGQERAIEVSLIGRCLVTGNAELLHRACENILRNALLHTAGSAPIRLEMMPGGPQEVRIAVLDRGPGLPEEMLSRIFEPFARHVAETTSATGHGLGLAIAARVVAMHGGRIQASNRAGGGLCVEIFLPCISAGK